jgi:hypothetical protein
MNKPSKGQCNYQEPYNHGKLDDFYLFNLDRDYHELHDQKAAEPARLAAMHIHRCITRTSASWVQLHVLTYLGVSAPPLLRFPNRALGLKMGPFWPLNAILDNMYISPLTPVVVEHSPM